MFQSCLASVGLRALDLQEMVGGLTNTIDIVFAVQTAMGAETNIIWLNTGDGSACCPASSASDLKLAAPIFGIFYLHLMRRIWKVCLSSLCRLSKLLNIFDIWRSEYCLTAMVARIKEVELEVSATVTQQPWFLQLYIRSPFIAAFSFPPHSFRLCAIGSPYI